MYNLLSGLRVVEMGHIALGPQAAQMLGDYGAEIIKVESLSGDLYRANGVSRTPGMSAQWMACNRNKHSLALDLKSEAGRAVLRELLETADAFLHNMRPLAVKRLGFDYEAVREINPKIVYCFSGGFGQSGPFRHYPAFDDIIQAYSGLAQLNSVQTGQPELVPMVVCDTITGLSLGQAVLAGLLSQRMTDEGVCIEVPMYEVMVSAVMNQHLSGAAFEPPEGPVGYKRVMDPARRPCKTADGYLVHGVYKVENWRKLFEKLGREDLLASGMVTDRHTVTANISMLYGIMMDEIMPTRTSAQWRVLFDELDIPYGEVRSLDALLEDEHLQAVDMFQQYEHPSEGSVRQVRQPVTVSGQPRQADRPPPRVGEDSQAVLSRLGFSAERIAELTREGVIGVP